MVSVAFYKSNSIQINFVSFDFISMKGQIDLWIKKFYGICVQNIKSLIMLIGSYASCSVRHRDIIDIARSIRS